METMRRLAGWQGRVTVKCSEIGILLDEIDHLRAERGRALREAADAWDDPSPENMDRLKALAAEHYSPGGPSMPAIFMRLRADQIEAGA